MDNTMKGLPPEKAIAFRDFVGICAERGLLQKPSALSDADTGDGITDKATLIRFLRARKFNVEDAYKQLNATATARNDYSLYSLYDKIEVAEFEKARKLYPHWSGRQDKLGQPICIFDLSTLNSKILASYKLARTSTAEDGKAASPELLRSFVYHEALVRFILPLCSSASRGADTEDPITSCLYLVDVSSFRWRQAWNLKEYAQDISALLANNYPEVIDRVFVIGAPSYFSRIWSFLKSWIDPVTASKIVFLSKGDVLPTLSDHMDVVDIPRSFGGEFDYQPGMLPAPNDAIKRILGWTSGDESVHLPSGPLKWIVEDGLRTAIAVGAVDGKMRYDHLRSKGTERQRMRKDSKNIVEL